MQFNYARDWHSAFLVKLLPGDDANAAGGNSGDQQQLQDIDDYTNVSTSNSSIQSIWDLYYRTIALSNLVIQNLEGSSLSNKDRAAAEAKFFRAWCYFELTTMFGDVPLRLKLPEGAEDFGLGKSPRSEIYTQVKADLEDAIQFLPSKSAVSDVFRVSKGAAEALMGKVLVFEGNYNQAIPFFESVINDPSHDLEATPADVWSVDNEFGQESLLELGYISTTGRDWGNIAWGGRNESNLHIQLMGPRGDGIFNVNSIGLLNGWGFNLPTNKLAMAFDASGDVVRKGATLMTEAELIAAGGAVDAGSATGGVIWDYEGAIRLKYATRSEDTSSGGVRELNYTARTELNKIRQRAGLADIDPATSGSSLFDAIVNEKFLELAHEGQRFWDLVRWGRAATELAGTGYTSKNDLFPIPQTEIDKNTGLTDADQNPGY